MRDFHRTLGASYDDNILLMDRLLRVGNSFDLIRRPLTIGGTRMVFYYLEGFLQTAAFQKLLMHLLSVGDFGDGSPGAAERFAQSSLPAAETVCTDSVDRLLLAVLSGCCAYLCEGFGACGVILDMRSYPAREASEPENDRVMRGSRDGFVETLLFNASMIRRRIRDPALTVEYVNVGDSSRTDLALVYMADRADGKYVARLSEALRAVRTDSLVLGHRSVAEVLMRRRWYNPFPRIRMTERPDAAAASVLEGSVVQGSGVGLGGRRIMTKLFDFLQETDDYYVSPLTGTYLRVLRHAVFLIAVFVTPLWYLFLNHPDWIPQMLRLIVPQNPGALPILLQLYLTEFALDGLKLASLNTPNVLSNSLSVVGGLLLGDFAVTVGWLSPDVILYMAVVGIANFTQSSYELGYAFKYVRLMLLTLTALFDVWGFAAGVAVSVVLLVTNRAPCGGRGYLYPLIPFHGRALARLLFRVRKWD